MLSWRRLTILSHFVSWLLNITHFVEICQCGAWGSVPLDPLVFQEALVLAANVPVWWSCRLATQQDMWPPPSPPPPWTLRLITRPVSSLPSSSPTSLACGSLVVILWWFWGVHCMWTVIITSWKKRATVCLKNTSYSGTSSVRAP